ncbi:MAG: glutathione peroxidase [Flavobacterium sp.]|nr:glutathione peroxidase [Pedobacter sp.]
MKYLLFAVLPIMMFTSATSVEIKTIYDFKIKSIDGEMINFSKFKGKKILIVNTASKCGFTPQYKALEELQLKFKDQLIVIGFPSDNFGGQEFKLDSDIKSFCQKNYGVTFPLTTRVDVKGENINPVFKYLCNKTENGVLNAKIGWNFNKFLIDESGRLVAHFDSKIEPDSPEVLKYLTIKQ